MTDIIDEPMETGLLLVTFLLGETVFGIDTGEVQEVVRVGRITPVHHAPADVVGSRNLRDVCRGSEHLVAILDPEIVLASGDASRHAPPNKSEAA